MTKSPQEVRHCHEGTPSRLGDLLDRLGVETSALAEGRVFLGRRRVLRVDEWVRHRDEIRVAPPTKPAPLLRILYRDRHVVAVDKPAGVPTIPDLDGAAHSLVVALARQLDVLPGGLHPTSRLDRDVSGVVVFACSPRGRDLLARAREENVYRRRYVALAGRAPHGPTQGVWSFPIGRHPNPKLRAAFGRASIPAETAYHLVGTSDHAALLSCAPRSGRTHQIRVHASHAGASLLGDRAYGGRTRMALPNGTVLTFNRIALHATNVEIPIAGTLTLTSPVPDILHDWWRSLGGDEKAWKAAADEDFL